MGVQVSFNYGGWLAAFPEFQAIGITQEQADFYVNLSAQYLRNDGQGPVGTVLEQTNLLYLIVAHIAWLFQNNPVTQQPATTLVGRIAAAGEGSVNVSAEMPADPNAAWFNQTKYGAAFWAGSKQYRTARYITKPLPYRRIFNPWQWPY